MNPFEKKNWSEELRKNAQKVFNRVFCNLGNTEDLRKLFSDLLDSAINEGFERAQNTVSEWIEPPEKEEDFR